MRTLFIAMLALVMTACATNPIKDAWVDPQETLPVEFEKTLVVVVMSTPADRRVAEDAWLQALPMIKGESSYRSISDEELRTLEKQREKVTAAGFKHVLVMRFVGAKQELVSRPSFSTGFYDRAFWGIGGGGVMIESSGTESRERVTFELSLYELGKESLVWTGNGQVTDPRHVDKTVNTLAKGVLKQWQEQGLVPKPE